MKKIIPVVMALLLIAGGAYLVRQKKLSIGLAGKQPVRSTMVRTALATRGDLQIYRTFLARVEPWRSAKVGSQILSRITHVPVEVGESVPGGGVLALLEDNELTARVRGAEAGVSQAKMQARSAGATVAALEQTLAFRKKELAHDRILVEAGAIARIAAETLNDQVNEIRGRLRAMEKTLEAANQQIKLREQELAQARIRLSYGRIWAPFDGVVAERLVDPGDMAAPGKPLVILEDHTRFRISFNVPQAELASITPEMEVMVQSGLNLNLSVARIYPTMNQDRTLTVECDARAASGLRAGKTLAVRVVLDHFKDQILVPEQSLIPDPKGGEVVFIVENGVTKAMPVTIAGRNQGLVAVTGLEPGTPVILSTYLGWNRLAAGEAVEVLP
jgi:RND family efflux transporter MFP subunit